MISIITLFFSQRTKIPNMSLHKKNNILCLSLIKTWRIILKLHSHSELETKKLRDEMLKGENEKIRTKEETEHYSRVKGRDRVKK